MNLNLTKNPEFSSEVLGFLPLSYQEVVNKLIAEILSAKGIRAKRKIFNKFVSKYTAIPEIWHYWINLEKSVPFIMRVNNSSRIIERRSYGNFYWEWLDFTLAGFLKDRPILPPTRKTTTAECLRNIGGNLLCLYGPFTKGISTLEVALQFPNRHLRKLWNLYSQFSASPMDNRLNQNYKKALILYEKIGAVEDDAEKWLECLKEANDEKFVIDNLELRLGKAPYNKKLWRILIEYLKSINHEDYLRAYSRYCRLFFEENDMLEEYRNEIYRLNTSGKDVSESFIDAIKFELEFGSVEVAKELLIKALESINVFSKSFFKFALRISKLHGFHGEMKPLVDEKCKMFIRNKSNNNHPCIDVPFNFVKPVSFDDSLFNQTFSLPITIMDYIIRKSKFIVSNKLIKTCKYFFIKKDILLIWNFKILWNISDLEIFEESMYSNPDHPFLTRLEKIWIGRTFKVKSNNPMACSMFLPKLNLHEIKHLKLDQQILSIQELNFISESKTIETVWLFGIQISGTISFEEIFDKFPNAYNFTLFPSLSYLTTETSKNLATIKRKGSLRHLYLEINPIIDPNDFSEFLKKNAAPKANWQIIIGSDPGYKEQFKDFIKKTSDSWEPQSEMPLVIS